MSRAERNFSLELAWRKNAYLLFGDEASFPQWGTLTYTWARKGEQPTIETSDKRKGYKVFGLIDYFSGRCFFKTQEHNPHRSQVVYLAETDFGRLDLYRSLAPALGLEPVHRRAALWRDIKARIQELADGKAILPLWIIDEAQNLPVEFFRDLPTFLNFAFDSRDLMAIWLLGHPRLAYTLERTPYATLASRIQVRLRLPPIIERERFKQFISHAFTQGGAHCAPRRAAYSVGRIPALSCCAKPPRGCRARPDASSKPACSWPSPRG